MRLEAAGSDGTTWLFRSDPGDPEHSLDDGHDYWARRAEDDPDAHTVPEPYRPAAAAVVRALGAGNTDLAERTARALRVRAEEEHDDSHPYALRARELHAHTLLVQGDPAAAADAYVEVARVWGGDDYWDNARRACACWGRITEPEEMVAVSGRLLRLLRAGGPEGDDLRRHVTERLALLAAGTGTAS